MPQDHANRVPLILCVDIEPDERDIRTDRDAAGPWQATDDCLALIAALRKDRRERRAEPVLVNWFWRADPQIQETFGRADFAVTRFLGRIQHEGDPADEHGNHPHAWRWSDARRVWFNDFADADWIAHCIRLSHETLVGVLPRRPTAVRFGDRFTSAAAVRQVVALGYTFDLTPEPGHRRIPMFDREPLTTGALPDYRKTPTHPYFPSPEDPTRAARSGSGPLRTIPVTTYPHRWLTRRYPFVRSRVATLNLADPPADIQAILEDARKRRTRPIVAVMRTGDFDRHRGPIQANLLTLFARDGIRFATPHTFEDP